MTCIVTDFIYIFVADCCVCKSDVVNIPAEVFGYITIKAARIFVDRLVSDQGLRSYTEQDELRARSILMDEGYCNGNKLIVPLYYMSNVDTDKLIALTWQQQVDETISDCILINTYGVESTTIYDNLEKGLYPAVILDWTASYFDPIGYLAPLLSCQDYVDETCLKGESVYSGSFWASIEVEKLFLESEPLQGEERINTLLKIDELAS